MTPVTPVTPVTGGPVRVDPFDLSDLSDPSITVLFVGQDFFRRSSRVVERALGEKEALDVLLDYAADEGDNTNRGDRGQPLNEAMILHEVSLLDMKGLIDDIYI